MLDLGEQRRTGERGENLGSFNSYDLALTLTYAYSMGDFSAGISAKYIRSKIAAVGARRVGKGVGSSFAVDLGVLYQGILGDVVSKINSDALDFLYVPGIAPYRRYVSNRLAPGLSVGLAMSNIGPGITYIDPSQAYPLPTNIRLGIAGNLVDTDVIGLQVAADFYKPLINSDPFVQRLFTAWWDDALEDEYEDIDIHLGVEATVLYLWTLRGGRSLDRDGQLKLWTWGFSIGPETARLSYARTSDDETPMGDDAVISLSLSF